MEPVRQVSGTITKTLRNTEAYKPEWIVSVWLIHRAAGSLQGVTELLAKLITELTIVEPLVLGARMFDL